MACIICLLFFVVIYFLSEYDMDRVKEVCAVTLKGSVINVVLIVMKLAAGLLGHSAAMIADAIHSVTDFATDFVVMVFVKLGNKPVDKDHDYGHGKYETIASSVIAIALFGVGVLICYSGLVKIFHAAMGETLEQPGYIALLAAVASIILKEWAYRFTVSAGRRLQSEAVIANAWHHRSDALSSVGTLFGIGGAILLGHKWAVLDPLAAIVVSFFIIKAAYSLIKQNMEELTDASLPESVEDEIKRIVSKEKGVSELHNLRTRRIGNAVSVDMHVRMDGSISLYEAHAHATDIENDLRECFGNDAYINIHIEPKKKNGKYENPNKNAVKE